MLTFFSNLFSFLLTFIVAFLAIAIMVVLAIRAVRNIYNRETSQKTVSNETKPQEKKS